MPLPENAVAPHLSFLVRLEAIFDAAQDIAEDRRILIVERGNFEGPHFRGVIRAGGGDWILVRPDGVAELDIRLTLETTEGALIYARGNGLFDMASEVRQALQAGEKIDRDRYYFRTAFSFETSSPSHLSLNRLLAVGVGGRTPTGMITDVFAVG